jgi:hypothetical protein
MSQLTDYLMIITAVLVLVVLCLLIYSVFFQKNRDRSRWKWVVTILAAAGSAFSGLFALKASPPDLAIAVLGCLFGLPILAITLLEFIDYVSGVRSGSLLFHRCQTIYEEHITKGRNLESVASDLNVSVDYAAALLQVLTLCRDP